ncbi:MAG: GrpE protein, partial [Actinomycetia bacterium]|nr:GrpE protein [Actinomycetes bacterium]
MSDNPEDGPVIRDKRRIDPLTGKVIEQPPAPEAAEPEVADDAVQQLQAQLDERTSDLQRLQAEYANYRKRVERDRVAVKEQATGTVLGELLPILDDIGRARDHDELTGGFKSVGEALEAAVGKLGLVRFGENGEPFDPNL